MFNLLIEIRFAGKEKAVQESIRADIINQQDSRGYSCLHWAALNGNEKIMDMLIKLGANVNLRNNVLKTALQKATERSIPKFDIETTCNDVIDVF